MDNVLNGFSDSCFAYGPKDSGKSYSMFGNVSGSTNSMGIETSSDGTTSMLRSAGADSPRDEQHCDVAEKSRDTADDTNITISFAEVGQDKVFDMLADQTSTASCKTTTTTGSISTTELLQEEETRKHQPVHRKALKLREHPEQGVYVENLRKAPVKSSADILRYLEEGIRRRNAHTESRSSSPLPVMPLAMFIVVRRKKGRAQRAP